MILEDPGLLVLRSSVGGLKKPGETQDTVSLVKEGFVSK